MRFAKAGKLTDGSFFDVVVKAVPPLVSSNPGYQSHFAYIRNGVARTMSQLNKPFNKPNPNNIRQGESVAKNLHMMNTVKTPPDGYMGQINMYSDANQKLVETLFEFRFEKSDKPGELVDDKEMLFKMAFVDFDKDRRQSSTESFCVNADQLEIDITDIDLAKTQNKHPDTEEPYLFIPGLLEEMDGRFLEVDVRNVTCNGRDGGYSLKVTGTTVGFLCDNPEKYDEYFWARKYNEKTGLWTYKPDGLKTCKDCFHNRKPEQRCHGPTEWNVKRDGSIVEDLSSAGKEWQFYPEHPTASDYTRCETCKHDDPPCYSVQKCQQNVMREYNNPYVNPWKRSLQLSFSKPSFEVTYGLGCQNIDGKEYKAPLVETCDRNFVFTCSTWRCVQPPHPIHNPITTTNP